VGPRHPIIEEERTRLCLDKKMAVKIYAQTVAVELYRFKKNFTPAKLYTQTLFNASLAFGCMLHAHCQHIPAAHPRCMHALHALAFCHDIIYSKM
jgi:hypothetical protein